MIHFISISVVCFNESLHCHWWQRERTPYTNYYAVSEGACCSNNPPPPSTAQRRDIYTVYLIHTARTCVCARNNHKRTRRHIFFSMSCPSLLPLCANTKKRDPLCYSLSLWSILCRDWTPGGPGAASVPPRFAIPGHER